MGPQHRSFWGKSPQMGIKLLDSFDQRTCQRGCRGNVCSKFEDNRSKLRPVERIFIYKSSSSQTLKTCSGGLDRHSLHGLGAYHDSHMHRSIFSYVNSLMNCFRPKWGYLLMTVLVREKRFTSHIKYKKQIKSRKCLNSLLLNILCVLHKRKIVYSNRTYCASL